jgi:hypothetical protein
LLVDLHVAWTIHSKLEMFTSLSQVLSHAFIRPGVHPVVTQSAGLPHSTLNVYTSLAHTFQTTRYMWSFQDFLLPGFQAGEVALIVTASA